VSDWTKEQRSMAAAHLCDLAGVAFREGRFLSGKIILEEAAGVPYDITPDACYRRGLLAAECSPMPVAAAVASILRGEHPVDSLPGRIESQSAHALELVGNPDLCEMDHYGLLGGIGTLSDVLQMLGCKVPQ
jgi:hypothetical protein